MLMLVCGSSFVLLIYLDIEKKNIITVAIKPPCLNVRHTDKFSSFICLVTLGIIAYVYLCLLLITKINKFLSPLIGT